MITVIMYFLPLFAAVFSYAARIAVARESRESEVMVPMRDGVKLHTVVVMPREGHEGFSESGKYPAVVDRSPYGYGDMEWLTDIFLPFGFVAVGQDVRGTELSEGNYSMWCTDGNDSRDLGDWIVSQEWSNGIIYTLGASADGIASLQTPRSAPSWLSGQYIIWATSAMYDVLFPFGTYKQKTAEDWLLGLTMPNPDFVNFNIEVLHNEEPHTDFWSLMELDDDVFANVNFPNAFWAGWYDLFVMGTIQAFEGYNHKSNPSVQGKSIITIDACGHCLEAGPYFNSDTAVLGRTLLPLGQMLMTYGIVPTVRPSIKAVTFYVMSSNDSAGYDAGQYWTTLDTWPEAKMTDYYFHPVTSVTADLPALGVLSTEPIADDYSNTSVSSSWVHDPADPVPTKGGNNLPDSIGGSIPCGPMDQQETDTSRTDQLLFQTAVVGSDEELVLSGPLFATLFVSSDAIDTDFMVKISDVYPTGEVRILQDNAVRMRWREATLEPVYMQKGEVYEVTLNLWNTSYVLAPGHALRVAVASSNYPRFSVNPNNGLLLADEAYPGENITASNSLYHSAQYPSRVTLPVIQDKHAQLPDCDVLHEMRTAFPQITDHMLEKFAAYQASLDRQH